MPIQGNLHRFLRIGLIGGIRPSLLLSGSCKLCKQEHAEHLDPVALEDCQHSFCRNCITVWASKGNNECPECGIKLWESFGLLNDAHLRGHDLPRRSFADVQESLGRSQQEEEPDRNRPRVGPPPPRPLSGRPTLRPENRASTAPLSPTGWDLSSGPPPPYSQHNGERAAPSPDRFDGFRRS
jgi:hypothetical protein